MGATKCAVQDYSRTKVGGPGCAPHCSKCAASEDKACNAPGIIKSGIVCRGPFDSQCVWPEDHEAHKHKYRGSALTLPAGEPTDYKLDTNSPLLKCSTLSCLDAAISELPVTRRRAYVLHMDPSIYQLGDPSRGSSVPLAPQLSYLPKRLVVHFGMRLRLRDNSEVLALGGAVTGVRVYCVVVACRAGPFHIRGGHHGPLRCRCRSSGESV